MAGHMDRRHACHGTVVDVCNKLRAGYTDFYADSNADLYVHKNSIADRHTYFYSNKYADTNVDTYINADADTVFNTDRYCH